MWLLSTHPAKLKYFLANGTKVELLTEPVESQEAPMDIEEGIPPTLFEKPDLTRASSVRLDEGTSGFVALPMQNLGFRCHGKLWIVFLMFWFGAKLRSSRSVGSKISNRNLFLLAMKRKKMTLTKNENLFSKGRTATCELPGLLSNGMTWDTMKVCSFLYKSLSASNHPAATWGHATETRRARIFCF